MTATTMKTIAIERYGGPEVLAIMDLPAPRMAPNQVVIRVAAAGLNPADTALRAGQFRFFIRHPFPLVLGSDLAGTVEQVGEKVTRFSVGDRVHGLLPLLETGAYAQFAAIDEDSLSLVPDALTLTQAAAIPLAALSAYQALFERAKIKAGDTVLITGASGGVGTFAVQLAHVAGAHVVTLTSARNQETMRTLGADVCLDYGQADALKSIGQVNAILDCARTLRPAHAHRLLVREGTYVSVVPLANPVRILRAALRGRRFRWLKVRPDGHALQHIDQWISDRRVAPVIEHVYSPQEIADAHRRIDSHRVRGKLVLQLDFAHRSNL
ncbi:NADP-dependent oxidoreductase [Arthrobacter sp. MDT1-65]